MSAIHSTEMKNLKPSVQDENTFMDQLLSGFDSAYSASSQNCVKTLSQSRDVQPALQNIQCSLKLGAHCDSQCLLNNVDRVAETLKDNSAIMNSNILDNKGPISATNIEWACTEDPDLAELFEGAENWNWSDELSPIKINSKVYRIML